MDDKINHILGISEQVIRDCSLKNGAIVAANSLSPNYPAGAKNYRFVWPRDAAFTCVAGKMTDIKIYEAFFRWCYEAEDVQNTGLLYENYFVSGKKARRHFQPDQSGTVLWAVYEVYKDTLILPEMVASLVRCLADGLCRVWDSRWFNLVCQDLWEERLSFPDLEESFTYSLASCSRGLLCADVFFPNKKWRNAALQMKDRIMSSDLPYFCRSIGKVPDERIGASLLGLIFPFNLIPPDHPRMMQTLSLMEEKIIKNFGVYRYEQDDYDGWMFRKTIHRKKGAGYWPLLNFWLSIYFLKTKNRKKAEQYFFKSIKDIDDSGFIPEQVFNNRIQQSVKPLCWSHTMFILAYGLLFSK